MSGLRQTRAANRLSEIVPNARLPWPTWVWYLLPERSVALAALDRAPRRERFEFPIEGYGSRRGTTTAIRGNPGRSSAPGARYLRFLVLLSLTALDVRVSFCVCIKRSYEHRPSIRRLRAHSASAKSKKRGVRQSGKTAMSKI